MSDVTPMPAEQFDILAAALDDPPTLVPEMVALASDPRAFVRRSVDLRPFPSSTEAP